MSYCDTSYFIDSTYIRVHQHASSSRKEEKRAIGKSRAGNTTKIHMLADGNGRPIDFEITGGEVHDFCIEHFLYSK